MSGASRRGEPACREHAREVAALPTTARSFRRCRRSPAGRYTGPAPRISAHRRVVPLQNSLQECCPLRSGPTGRAGSGSRPVSPRLLLLCLIMIRAFAGSCCWPVAGNPGTRRSWCPAVRWRCCGVRSHARTWTGLTALSWLCWPGCCRGAARRWALPPWPARLGGRRLGGRRLAIGGPPAPGSRSSPRARRPRRTCTPVVDFAAVFHFLGRGTPSAPVDSAGQSPPAAGGACGWLPGPRLRSPPRGGLACQRY
jgi:hypothetical protein